MIKTAKEIELLLQDKPSEPVPWYCFTLTEGGALLNFLYPCPGCIKALEWMLEDKLQESSHWDGDAEYFCKGFYYEGELFLVMDNHSDGEDEWDEDEQTVNKDVAQKVMTVVMNGVRHYYINKMREE